MKPFFTRGTLLILVLVSGCGDDRGLVRVHGTVTFDGGPMPGDGYLRFVPLRTAEGFPRRPGLANFTTTGKYQTQSFDPGDGLFPGEYAVFPYCWEIEPTMGGPPAKSYLPARYGDTAQPPFLLTIESGASTIEFDLNIDSTPTE